MFLIPPPHIFTTLQTLFWGERCLQNQGNNVRKVKRIRCFFEQWRCIAWQRWFSAMRPKVLGKGLFRTKKTTVLESVVFCCGRSALTLQSLLFWKKQGFFPKKARVFLFAEPLKSLEKRGKTPPKKQGKSENEKSKEIKKSKDWRVRVLYYLYRFPSLFPEEMSISYHFP